MKHPRSRWRTWLDNRNPNKGEYGEHLCSKCGQTSELPGTAVGCSDHEGVFEGYRNGKYQENRS